jgi:hypothetical protein
MVYKILVYAVAGQAGSASVLYATINADTGANYINEEIAAIDNSLSSQSQTRNYTIIADSVTTAANTGYAFFEGILHAKALGTGRLWMGTCRYKEGSSQRIFINGGQWTNTADNITNLQIGSTVANSYGVGTLIEIYARR